MIQIDTPVLPSLYRLLCWGCMAALFSIVVALLPIFMIHKLALVVLLLVSLVFAWLCERRLCWLSTLRDKQGLGFDTVANTSQPHYDFLQWQIQFVQGKVTMAASVASSSHDIYLARLQQIDDNGIMLRLIFDIEHPLPAKMHFGLWQDQVPADTWRQLKILARR